MIDELSDAMSHEDRNIARLAYQSTLFPAPATDGENYQFGKSIRAERIPTFAVNPQKGTWTRRLPL